MSRSEVALPMITVFTIVTRGILDEDDGVRHRTKMELDELESREGQMIELSFPNAESVTVAYATALLGPSVKKLGSTADVMNVYSFSSGNEGKRLKAEDLASVSMKGKGAMTRLLESDRFGNIAHRLVETMNHITFEQEGGPR